MGCNQLCCASAFCLLKKCYLLPGTCQQLTDSEAFLVASELLQTTASSIYEETITVEEVRMITIEPHAQQNLEQLLELQLRSKEQTAETMEKLQCAKNRLITFERERSQLVSLITRWRTHIQPRDQSELSSHLTTTGSVSNYEICYTWVSL